MAPATAAPWLEQLLKQVCKETSQGQDGRTKENCERGVTEKLGREKYRSKKEAEKEVMQKLFKGCMLKL